MKRHTNITLIYIATIIASLSIESCRHEEFTQQDALTFLYEYMPLPDKVDYDTAFYRRNIASSFQAREEMPWGKTVPEREFKHFVLPVRVNNENLDESRITFYAELKDRVRHLTMQEAILEVNHWCHEKVTYTPSDERTSSPSATVKTAYGRCGEESTFTVAALRSVGIPARQVYTPRWAHTDDNHAWVEAWADGQWYFLGACEPEAVLNLGWFNAPASRGMLMHTKAFGHYDGPEEIITQTACYTEINVTANYAPVAKTHVKVTDTKGKAIQGAKVEFKIYNYAEFYTVSTKTTDQKGIATLEAGLGDLMAWSYKDGHYGFAKCTVSQGDTTTIILDKSPQEAYTLDIEIIPPRERNTLPTLTESQIAHNKARLAHEDSLRNAYTATFDTSTPLLTKTRGNHAEIRKFLTWADDKQRANDLLSVITDKDLRDISDATLKEVYTNTPPNPTLPTEIYNKYILNPRIANEMILPYRRYFNTQITPEQKATWQSDINTLIRWTSQNISIDDNANPQHLRMLPTGVWRNRNTDKSSRDIFFVAMSRTLGIPSRIDPVTKKVQYANANLEWVDVQFDTQSPTHTIHPRQGTIKATYQAGKTLANPKYYTHFTLSAIKDGRPVLMNYAEDDSYQSLLKQGSKVDTGDYMLVTGTRMANGNVLAHIEIFNVKADTQTQVPLIMRSDSKSLQVIGTLNSENHYHDLRQGIKSILSTTGRGYYIIGIIAPNHEPTNHVLHDIALYKDQLEAWGGKIILLFRDETDAKLFDIKQYPQLPDNTVFGIDTQGQIAKEMPGTLPIIKIADTFNRVVYTSEGYTIGIGETLVKAIDKLNE